jgi:hypothetical protein
MAKGRMLHYESTAIIPILGPSKEERPRQGRCSLNCSLWVGEDMTKTALITKTNTGTYLIRIIPDHSNLARYQQWYEVTSIEVSEEVKKHLLITEGKEG